MKNTCRLISLPLLALAGAGAYAHAGGGHAHGLLDGLLHPLAWDHALVALVAGLVAAQWRERAWRLPLLFIGGMALGMAGGVALPAGASVESGVMLSLLAAGVLLLAPLREAGRRLTWLAVAVVGACGAAHGLVHGVEAGGAPLSYLAGVLGGTALLHAGGLLLGRSPLMRAPVLQGIGATTAVLGAWLLVAG